MDASATASPPQPTRRRILDSALTLFAAQGYEGTSVGQIEAAAGLAPRSGGLYKHFASKRELLDAALAERIAAIAAIDRRLELPPLGDLRAELTMVGHLALGELLDERELARLVMKEGDRFPELADAFHDAVVRRGHAIGSQWVRSRAAARGVAAADPDALAQVLVDAVVGYALQHFMFGERLEAVARERFLAAWVDTAMAVFAAARKEER